MICKKVVFLLGCLMFVNLLAQSNNRYSFDENAYPKTDLSPQATHNTNRFPGRAITDNNWSRDFTVPGVVDGPIYAMATDGTNLYVGGRFSVAGNILANGVAKWDGHKWASLGEGVNNGVSEGNNFVQTLAFIDGKLFVGGSFKYAGRKLVWGVAYWDGADWQTLGNPEEGLRNISVFSEGDTLLHPGHVSALGAYNHHIIFGGNFNLAGTKKATGVAAWNLQTNEWESFEGGLGSHSTANAYAFVAQGNDLYVGGNFDVAGSIPAKGLAKWNGNHWSEVGGGANGMVYDLTFDQSGNLLVAGTFDSIGTIKASGVARWNHTAWEALGDANFAEEGSKPFVKKISLFNNQVYVSGSINHIDGQPAWGKARWDGDRWTTVGGEIGFAHGLWAGGINAMEVVGNRLYVGGDFTKAADTYAINLAYWDETSSDWQKLSDGSKEKGIYDGTIAVVAGSGNAIYAGGSFKIAGGTHANSIAKWDGQNWHSLGEGFENGINRGGINTILVDGDDVYVGGYFGFAGTTEAYHIAKWDGRQWSALGIGVGGVAGAEVKALAKVDHYLYAGGFFAIVGDEENYELPANAIARFNLITQRWEAVGEGFELFEGFPGQVNTLEYHNGLLYAGGRFVLADKQFAHNIAVWNGTSWEPLGETGDVGVNGIVSVIKIINDEVIVGGSIERNVGGSSFYGLLKWTGEKWAVFGGNILYKNQAGRVFEIVSHNGNLIIAGLFDEAGHASVANLARWDGSEWHDLGGGTEIVDYAIRFVSALLLTENRLTIGGQFTSVGGTPSVAFAQYDLKTTSVATPRGSSPSDFVLHQNYPNPFNPATTISFQMPQAGIVSLKIFDQLGREVKTLLHEQRAAGQHQISFDALALPSGIYIYQLQANDLILSKKMLLIR